MLDVLIALIPASVFGVYNFGLGALARIIISIAACVAIEAIYEYFMHKEITVGDFSAAVTGLLLALNVPVTLPIGMLIIGDAFAIIIVKMLFGGLGQNFMNPALGARCFLFISFAKWMSDFATDAYTGPTPLAILKGGEEAAGLAQPELLNMFLGKHIYILVKPSPVIKPCHAVTADILLLNINIHHHKCHTRHRP